MVSRARRLISPKTALFGSRDRMQSMHDSAGLAALATSAITTTIPWMAKDAVIGYHVLDVLILGANPILAAAAAYRAASQDLSVGIGLCETPDEWPYDLAANIRGLSLIEEIFRIDSRLDASPEWRLAQISRDLLGSFSGRIFAFPKDVAFAMASRQPLEEALVHARVLKDGKTKDPIQSHLISDFRSALSHHPVLSVRKGSRRTAIFAKRIVLVGMLDGFSKADGKDGGKAINWPYDRILSFGTAAWTPDHATEAAARMVDDLVSLSRVDFRAN